MKQQSSAPLVFLLGVALSALTASCQRNTGPRGVSGTIETDEVHVASRYGGRVERIHAWDGDTLAGGQLIAELDAAELRAQRDQASAQLDEWLAGARIQEIVAASNDWQSVAAEFAMADLDRKRAVELMKDKTISEAERDRLFSRATVLDKSVAAARSRHDLLLAGTRPERIAQARARLAEIDTQLREMRIVAPTNCVLEVLGIRVGDVLAPNREIATLILTQHLWVRVYVPAPWLGFIQLNTRVRVKVDSQPDKDFEGVVEQINRSAEFTPRNVQTVDERVKQVFGIKVRLNSQDPLRAGMAADVFFPGVPEARDTRK